MALGTTAVAMLPALAAGSAAHLIGGRSAVQLLPMLCLGTVTGSAAGAWAALRVDEAWLRGALGVRPVGAPGRQSPRQTTDRRLCSEIWCAMTGGTVVLRSDDRGEP